MFLYGAGGHAKVIIDILEDNDIKINGIYDDNKSINNLFEYKVYHSRDVKGPLIISIGNNKIRKKIAEFLQVNYGTAVHSKAIISKRSTIKTGTVIMPGAVIQSSTVIGNHCIINTGATIDHECWIENFVHIAPNATLCGNVTIGEGSLIGAGSTILPGVKIGKWCMIGAGTIITKDIADNVIVRASIHKVIKNNE